MTVTFTGLDKSEVDDAIARLTADLQAKLSKDDWTSSPLKAGIPSLSAQQVRELHFRQRLILAIFHLVVCKILRKSEEYYPEEKFTAAEI